MLTQRSAHRECLQAPLQPLMDNLESQTYETFERDPIKYRNYENAIHDALLDTPADKVSVIMVVRAQVQKICVLYLCALDTVSPRCWIRCRVSL